MESTIWARFVQFVKASLTNKFKTFMPGVIMGFYGAKSLLFSGVYSEMVTIAAYVLKYIGTVLMAFSSGLATAYGAYLIEKHKNKKDGPRATEKKRGNGKAA